jgi:hypothetical protein
VIVIVADHVIVAVHLNVNTSVDVIEAALV